jgi:hypothetical protein
VLTSGSAFIRHGHVWFILSEPGRNGGKVLCVNITTLDEDCVDDECVLKHSDFAWIEPNHPSAVAFSRAKVWDYERIEDAMKQGILRLCRCPIVPRTTLQKVIEAAKKSKELSQDLKALL